MRTHIRQHYKLYQERCEAEKIPMQNWAIPRTIWKEMEASKAGKKLTKKQAKLDETFKMVGEVSGFSRNKVIRAVAQFVVCDDQVSIFNLHSCMTRLTRRNLAVSGSSRQDNLPKLSCCDATESQKHRYPQLAYRQHLYSQSIRRSNQTIEDRYHGWLHLFSSILTLMSL